MIEMNATYSAEDNKLRLYASARLDAETYARIKAAGFRWAPKQDLFVAPSWTPSREDLLIELCGEIGDEDYSPEKRSADRAERFAGYRDRRATEAGMSADTFEAGPSAFGNQSRARAERAAARHDRHRTHAVSQWSKAEYWQTRTRAVISHALFRSSAHVRRGRLLTLEAERRKHESGREEYARAYAEWSRVAGLEGSDRPLVRVESSTFCGIDREQAGPGGLLAYTLANLPSSGWHYTHPRTGEESSPYSHLTDPADPITPAEAASLWLRGKPAPDDPNSYGARWSRHYENRIAYERAMLEAEGGLASEAEMEVGGWIGRHQIRKVNRSPATGRVVSVGVWGPHAWKRDKDGNPAMGIQTINIERLGEAAYRPPTDEERAAFAAKTKAEKAAKKATTPKAPPLINPTDEDAERLQAIWNERAADDHAKRGGHGEPPRSEVLRITQAEYSARSKGSYATFDTAEITEKLEKRGHDLDGIRGRSIAFKVRRTYAGGRLNAPDRVIILIDKPQKSIPWAEVERLRAEQPTPESMQPRFGELVAALSGHSMPEGEGRQVIDDARYIGWAYVSSLSQFGLTEAGKAAYEEYREQTQPEGATA